MSLDFYLQYEIDENEIEVFSTNITHNLTKMANAAGIYEALWHPDRIKAVYAKDIIPVLVEGYKKLIENPKEYKLLDSPNGWGMYEHFLPFVKNVLDACRQYPNAKITTST
jgi:hypothetical protein